MFEEKGDRPYANEDLYAGGLPDVCGRVRRERPRLSKRDSAADGLGVVRDAGKGIEVLDRRDSGYRRAEQEDQEMLCQEYVLQAERVVYRIRPKDDKHPVLLPIGGNGGNSGIHKDKLILKVAEGADDKEREYIVVSMTPRQDAPAQQRAKN